MTGPPDHHSALEADGLCKSYGGRAVVREVSLRLERREIVGLLGPNGAGKTTTFNMIAGIVRPNRGSIRIEGRDITDLPLYKRARFGLGYLTQEPSIFRKMSVEQNILAVLEVLGLSRPERRARLEVLLDNLGIGHLAKNMAETLSGGERRRLEIARALATQPLYMLLDEPFSGVDPKAVEEIQGIIRSMRDAGLGILITDHSVRETLAVTDRSYIIHEGRICVSGNAAELVNNPEARRLYLGERFTMHLPEEISAGSDQGDPVAPKSAPPGAARETNTEGSDASHEILKH